MQLDDIEDVDVAEDEGIVAENPSNRTEETNEMTADHGTSSKPFTTPSDPVGSTAPTAPTSPSEDSHEIDKVTPSNKDTNVDTENPRTIDSPNVVENERSYTPCLDEQVNPDDEQKGDKSSDDERRSIHESASVNTGIEGMETELISEDENENLLVDRERFKANAGDKENNVKRKSSKDDSFKKVTKSRKERHYRDKRDGRVDARRKRSKSRSKSKKSSCTSRSVSRSRSHSHSYSRTRRNNRFRRRENKRQEIQRYDVRHVIADRPSRVFRDKYGRNTSRTRSPSPPLRRRRSRSQSRSISPKYAQRHRSGSRKRSASRRRSISRRRRSQSRNISPRRRKPSTSRGRRQRSVSRSPMHRSPVLAYFSSSRSNSRARVTNGNQAARVLRSPPHSKSPSASRKMSNHRYHTDGSRSHSRSRSRNRSESRTRSRSRGKGKTKRRAIDKKTSRTRLKKKLPTRQTSPFAASPSRNLEHSRRSLSRSWEATNRDVSWNRSPNRATNDNDEPSWTPPLCTRPAENLTVILKNKDSNRRKREKKKKTERRRRDASPTTRREKRKQRAENAPAQPSKEVFASGDNILVSVSFNKDKTQQSAQQTTIVTLPPSKDQILSKKQNELRDNNAKRSRRSARDIGGGPRKHKKIDIKPVAIIDLDNSPFKEMTPSPKAVIVLSDSDHEPDKTMSNNKSQSNYSKASNAMEGADHGHDVCESIARVSSQPQSPITDTNAATAALIGMSGWQFGRKTAKASVSSAPRLWSMTPSSTTSPSSALPSARKSTSNMTGRGHRSPEPQHLIKFSITSNRRQLTNRWKSPITTAADEDNAGGIGSNANSGGIGASSGGSGGSADGAEGSDDDHPDAHSSKVPEHSKPPLLQNIGALEATAFVATGAAAELESSEKQQPTQPKVGPNTPPESGPCSPDAYDPFEPTKSPSQSPNDAIHSTNDKLAPAPMVCEDSHEGCGFECPEVLDHGTYDHSKSMTRHTLQQQQAQQQPLQGQWTTGKKSVDLVLALINSKASLDAASSMLSSTLEGEAIEKDILPAEEADVSPFKEKPICDDGAGATKTSTGIHVFSNIMIAPGKDTTSRLQLSSSQSRGNVTGVPTASSKISTPTKASPMKFGSSLISKLPMPPKSSKAGRYNGNDDNADVDSPYSPGSSDYEDLFEPPPISTSPIAGIAKKHGSRTARQSGKCN